MADYIPLTLTTGLLRGICPTCELLIHGAANVARLASRCGDLNVTHQPAQERLTDSSAPFRNVAFRKKAK